MDIKGIPSDWSLMDDLKSRDFTMNGLYYEVVSKKVIDLSGQGIRDIKNRRLRTIGTYNETFDLDYGRLLRLVRFKIEKGFEVCQSL